MGNIIGRFYFRQTSNGNLTGEFSNNRMHGVYVEGANLIKHIDGFEGDYETLWMEDHIPKICRLIIRRKFADNNHIFTLMWDYAGAVRFWGEAMSCEGMLIGDYRNFAIIRSKGPLEE